MQSKAQWVNLPKGKSQVEVRVLITAMDEGQGLLFASASSTSLHTWVQQGFPVTLVTDVCAQIHLDKTTVHHRSERPVKPLDPLRIPAWLTFRRGSFWSLKPSWADPPSALLASLSFDRASIDKLTAALPSQHWPAPTQSKIFTHPPLPMAISPCVFASATGSLRMKNAGA